MIRELTPEEFEATIADDMRLLDENDDTCAGFPLVEYVERCIGALEMDVDADDVEVHYAYMNDKRQICHVGLNFGDENLYLVVVVDVSKRRIQGHTVLDLSKLKTTSGQKG